MEAETHASSWYLSVSVYLPQTDILYTNKLIAASIIQHTHTLSLFAADEVREHTAHHPQSIQNVMQLDGGLLPFGSI